MYQRTRAYQTDVDIQRGLLAGFSYKKIDYFEAGTLLIDIVTGRNFKLIKRGYTTRPSLCNLSAEAKAARIQKVVDEILRDVRIEP